MRVTKAFQGLKDYTEKGDQNFDWIVVEEWTRSHDMNKQKGECVKVSYTSTLLGGFGIVTADLEQHQSKWKSIGAMLDFS